MQQMRCTETHQSATTLRLFGRIRSDGYEEGNSEEAEEFVDDSAISWIGVRTGGCGGDFGDGIAEVDNGDLYFCCFKFEMALDKSM